METKLYKIRWFTLAVLFMLKLVSNFSFAGPGLINNFYVSYYGVSYAAVDFMVMGGSVGAIVETPVIAVLVFRKVLQIRWLAILTAFFLVLDFLCFLCALLSNQLFFLIILSQIIAGLPELILEMIIATFAALWFPENQVGTAIGVVVAGTSIGNILGSIVFTHAQEYLPSFQFKDHNQSKAFHHNLTTNAVSIGETRYNLLKIYGILLAVAVFSLIYFVKFAKDFPLLPPTIAQALKREQESSERPKTNWREVLADSKTLWTDWTFLLACLVFGVIYHMNTFEYTLLGEMFRDKNTAMSSGQNTVIAGYTVSCFCAAAFVGCFLSGFLINRFKQYRRQLIIGSAASFISSVGFLVGFQTQYLWLTMVSNALYGMSTRISTVPLYDMITQHTYPMDETFASAWLACSQALFAVVAAELARFFYTYTGGLGVLLLQSISLFVVFLLTFYVKPKYKRLLADQSTDEERNGSELPLLKQEAISGSE